VGGLLFQKCQSGFATVGFHATETEGLAYGGAQATDTLLVIHNQQPDFKIVTHAVYP